MNKMIHCQKLDKEAEGLAFQPVPGELGLKIYHSISAEAWSMWVSHQTMLINEYRLNLMDDKAKEFLKEEMERFFFGEGSERPPGYTDE